MNLTGGLMSMFDAKLITTAFTIDGYRIVKNLGVVRGITVRSRSIVSGCRQRPIDIARKPISIEAPCRRE